MSFRLTLKNKDLSLKEIMYRYANSISINKDNSITIKFKKLGKYREAEQEETIYGYEIMSIVDNVKLINDLDQLVLDAANNIYGSDLGYKKHTLVFNSLHRFADIGSIDELLAYDVDKISEIRNVGATGFDIIMKARAIAMERNGEKIEL